MAKILLTSSDPALFRAAERAAPGANLARIYPDLPSDSEADDVWCFVDWLLEDTSGLEFCRRLRSNPATRSSHITMVLDGDDPVSRRRALASGADDYMPGPLSPERLTERLRHYLSSAVDTPTATHALGDLTLDMASHQVRWKGRLVPLRPREMRLLGHFLTHPDKLLTRPQLIALTGKGSEIGDERTVDVWVGKLRRTLEAHGVPPVLRTVRSLGYVFDTPELLV